MGLFSLSDNYASFGSVPVDGQFITECMPNASGDEIKVYLFGLFAMMYLREDMELPEMAVHLGMSQDEIRRAFRHWERAGLVERVGDNPVAYRYIPANYAVPMHGKEKADDGYERFSEAVCAVFGNDVRLHGQQIVKYYEWVVELGLPQEVVLMLIRHMISVKGKQFSYKAGNALAVELASQGVRTIEDAEVALTRNREAYECSRAVLRRLNMRREPTEPETEMCQAWMRDLGFTREAILAACDDTTAASVPSFKYLDGIIRRRTVPGDAAGMTGERYEKQKAENEARREPLLAVYRALGRGANAVTDGALEVYWDLRREMDDEQVIQYAAEQAGRANGRLEDVVNMVTSWKKKGIGNLEQARGYVEAFTSEKELLTALGEVWGVRAPSGERAHRLVRTWREAGASDETVLLAARDMKVASGHMSYLDAVMTRLIQEGALSPEKAAASLDAFRKDKPETMEKGSRRGPKQVTESRYDQRENHEATGEDVPQWVIDHREELNRIAQANTP